MPKQLSSPLLPSSSETSTKTATLPLAEQMLTGRPAAAGLAYGAIVILAPSTGKARLARDPEQEREALDVALSASICEIETLAAAVWGDGRNILEFQSVMLADDTLRQPALDAISAGAPADEAWMATLQDQIDDYTRSNDEPFRARAADLADLRDRVFRHLRGGTAPAAIPAGAIAAATDMTPSQFLETDWSQGGGVMLAAGSPSSHVAMLARARGIPMVTGLGDLPLEGHSAAIVDGTNGRIVLSPGANTKAALTRDLASNGKLRFVEQTSLAHPASTKDGVSITISINIAGPDDRTGIDPAACDGIGLFRTELMFRDGAPLPDEEAQYNADHQRSSLAASDNLFLPSGLPAASNTYTANTLNQYTAVNGAAKTYDKRGNLITDGVWTYGYDTENRLISASTTGTTVTYGYDGLDRRLWKNINGTFTFFASFGQRELAEYTGVTTLSLTRRFVYGAGLDEPVLSLDNTGTPTYQFADVQGSVIGLTNNLGQLTERYTYSAYGLGTVAGAGTAAFRYTGRRFDAETGLYFYRARTYSTTLGRFLQTDPIGIKGGINIYAYVGNDPLNKADPTGLASNLSEYSYGRSTTLSSSYFSPLAGAIAGSGLPTIPKIGALGSYPYTSPASTIARSTFLSDITIPRIPTPTMFNLGATTANLATATGRFMPVIGAAAAVGFIAYADDPWRETAGQIGGFTLGSLGATGGVALGGLSGGVGSVPLGIGGGVSGGYLGYNSGVGIYDWFASY